MRHFKKKPKSSFFIGLQSYIDTHIGIKRCTDDVQSLEEDFYAIDDNLDVDFSPADAEEKATPPMCGQYTTASDASKQLHSLEQAVDLSEITRMSKQPSFADNLFKIIDDKGLKDSTVYKKADIDRRLFSKIRSDSSYHPSKETAIKLCLALELGIAETERLLETAGYCLSMSSTSDLIIRYCIEQKEFNLISVNEALYYFSEPIL